MLEECRLCARATDKNLCQSLCMYLVHKVQGSFGFETVEKKKTERCVISCSIDPQNFVFMSQKKETTSPERRSFNMQQDLQQRHWEVHTRPHRGAGGTNTRAVRKSHARSQNSPTQPSTPTEQKTTHLPNSSPYGVGLCLCKMWH